MKKIFTLSLALASATALFAANPVVPAGAVAKSVYAKSEASAKAAAAQAAAEDDYEVYYPAPAGVFYLGLGMDNDNNAVPEAGVAPKNVNITFHTDVDLDYNDYEWTYTNPEGREVSAENQDIVMNVAETAVVEAPFLFAQGYSGRGTYTMARAGIVFGQGYYYKFYASNLNVAEIYSEFYNVAALAVNYEEAGKNLADEYPLKISDVNIKGWGELYRYGGALCSFDAIRMALIFTGAEIEANQVEADIYQISVENGTYTLGRKLATYVNTAIMKYDTYQGSYWYSIEFGPQEGTTAPMIDSDVMVVFRLADGVTTIVSPTMAGTQSNHESDPTTSFVIADYTRAGNEIKSGCLPYQGMLEGRYTTYCKHWTSSAKINYDVVPAGVDEIIAQPENTDKAVYNMMGVKVSDNGLDANLPAGLYITGGKKVYVR